MFSPVPLRLAFATLCLHLAAHAGEPSVDAGFLIYPEGETSANPRIPWIAPETTSDGQGRVMEVEALFRYHFGPFVTFGGETGGRLTATIRDNPRHKAHDLITLIDGDRRLSFSVTQKHVGKLPGLSYSRGTRTIGETRYPESLVPSAWKRIELRWNTGSATLTDSAGASLSLALPADFRPTAVEVSTRAVDELTLQGEGSLTLDWESGYAARVAPRDATEGPTLVRTLGFDTYIISRDGGQRDFPMLQVLNGDARERDQTVALSLRGEVGQSAVTWEQRIRVPARSGALAAIEFPADLPSDIYHLTIDAPGAVIAENDRRKHFLHARSSGDTGPVVPKFGLHDTDRKTFGFWPDTLPIHLYHVYARWGFTYGPGWETTNALPHDAAVEELNWNPVMDWGFKLPGLTPLVSLNSLPDNDWMRAREYEPARMKSYPWGKIGGFPRIDRYVEFVKNLVARYKGQKPLYEIENEPMAYLGGILPEDYADISRATAAAIRKTDPEARIYGISGTGHFQPWMKKAFAAGASEGLDGVTIHTYVTPRQPEAAQLPLKLTEIRDIIKETGRPLSLLNSETGTYIALRETVDRPITPERLDDLVRQGVEPFFKTDGWPNRAVDENSGAISFVRNAIYNFLSGTEYFTFFGWNDQWPIKNWWGVSRQSGFALVSASKDGERTPGLHTLALSVLTQQLKSARHLEGIPVEESGATGAIFPTTGGGQVAVLWSVEGTRNIMVQSPAADLVAVSLYGQDIPVSRSATGLARLVVGTEPVYLHSSRPGLAVLPSPVIAIGSDIVAPGTLSFTLVNRGSADWAGRLDFAAPEGWRVDATDRSFRVPQGERAPIRVAYKPAPGTPTGTHLIEARITLPGGEPFAFPIPVKIRPFFTVPAAASTFDWQSPAAWQAIQPTHDLAQPEQVVVGQAPPLASLQEERYWKGPRELSAKLRFAHDAKHLYLYAEVTDANFRLPARWPGVLGSSLEVFLDQRPPSAGRGTAAYGPGVTQLAVLPAQGDAPPELHQFTATKHGELAGISSAGGPLPGQGYWVALRLPLAPGALENGMGIDVGVNGPPAGGQDGRKNQLMLFGTASNSSDASSFGSASFETR